MKRAALAVALLATLAFAIGTLGTRPLEYVEGEVLFDAARIRQHLALYIDPSVGTFDYGALPARFFVLYTPIWAWLLAQIPDGAAAMVGRAVNTFAWFGFLIVVAWRAPGHWRRVAAAFAGASFFLAFSTCSARPDGVAVILAATALWRAARAGRVDAVGGVLFALAAFIKPNVVGIAAGTLAAQLWRDRRDLAAILGALATSLVLGLVLHAWSGGLWLLHLQRSTYQPFSGAHFAGEMSSGVPLFGAPLAFAICCGVRHRRDPAVRVMLPALISSTAWTLVCLAKFGASHNHWLEPAIAAVLTVAFSPVVVVSRRWAKLLTAQLVLTAMVAVAGAGEELWLAPRRAALIAEARALCGAAPGDVVLAPDLGVEMMLNHRIHTTGFQMTHLVRRGLFPLQKWLDDVERPEVRGLVLESGILEDANGHLSFDRLGPELRRRFAQKFVLAQARAGLSVYRLRDVEARR
jgi:hypothetical protein